MKRINLKEVQCRLCLKGAIYFLPLDHPVGHQRTIEDMFTSVTGFHCLESDPRVICKYCGTSLQETYRFLQMCRKTEEILHGKTSLLVDHPKEEPVEVEISFSISSNTPEQTKPSEPQKTVSVMGGGVQNKQTQTTMPKEATILSRPSPIHPTITPMVRRTKINEHISGSPKQILISFEKPVKEILPNPIVGAPITRDPSRVQPSRSAHRERPKPEKRIDPLDLNEETDSAPETKEYTSYSSKSVNEDESSHLRKPQSPFDRNEETDSARETGSDTDTAPETKEYPLCSWNESKDESCDFCWPEFPGQLCHCPPTKNELPMTSDLVSDPIKRPIEDTKYFRLCDTCGISTINKWHWWRHQDNHRAMKIGQKLTCDICGCSYLRKLNLRMHMLSHIDKNLICKCGKRFAKKTNYEVHLKVHNQERKIACRYCQKYFRTKKGRRVHEMIHQSEKNYVCPVRGCGQDFTQNSSLRSHVTHQHPDYVLPPKGTIMHKKRRQQNLYYYHENLAIKMNKID